MKKPQKQQGVDQEKQRKRKMFTALFTTAKTVSYRNPQSRGQGLSGESKVAILQLLQDEKE
jgi:hypothetical protein